MQLPVIMMELIDAVTDIDSARGTDLSVSVYIDSKAPSEVVAHVRGLFASTMSKVRLTLSYLDSSFAPHPGDDMAVIVAGTSLTIGAAAAAIRGVDVPVAIVTTLPATVDRAATEGGHAIPEGDIIAPYEGDWDAASEPIEFTDEVRDAIDERLGQWIVSVCQEKRLALAIAFPFLRRPLAVESVKNTSWQNAGIGLLPFLPGADLPFMTLNQVKMVLQIAAAYGQDMNTDRLKEMIVVVGGAYLCRTVARELTEFIPILGFAIRPGIAYSGTAAMGNAVIEYFEGGQDTAGVANVASKGVSAFGRLVNTIRNNPDLLADRVRANLDHSVPIVRDKAAEIVPVALELASEFAPRVRDAASDCVPIVKQAVNDMLNPKKADA